MSEYYFLIDKYFLIPLQRILPLNPIFHLLLRALKGITHLLTRKTQLHRLLLSSSAPDTLYYFHLLFLHTPMAVLEKKVPLDLLPKIVQLQNELARYDAFKSAFLESCKSMNGIDGLLEEIREVVRKEGIRMDSWMDMGFQGEDPRTDVRSTGIASLQHLLFLLKTHPETVQAALAMPYSISFACIVINCTAYLRDLLSKDNDCMNYYMLNQAKETILYEVRLGEAINTLLNHLNEEWNRKQPQDIMGFPAVFSTVKKLFP